MPPDATATAVADSTASTATAQVSNDPNADRSTAQTSVSTENWAKGFFKDDGSLDASVFERAPDEFKPLAKEMALYKKGEDLFKSHLSLREMASKKGIIEPLAADATPKQIEERAALMRKVNGAPDKPEGYGLAKPDGIPADMWDQKYADNIAALAHKHGLPPAALKELAAAELQYTQAAIEQNKKNEAAWFEGQDKLIRETLGKEGLDFGKGKDLAERAGRKWGIDPTNPLMKNASVFVLLTRIGRAMGEDNLVTGDTSEVGMLRMSADTAGATAKDIASNKQNPDYKAYWNAEDPRHQAVVDKVNALYAMAAKKK